MFYTIKTIENTDEINRCELFNIDNFQWRNVCHPKASGRMGYIKDKGFLIHLFCDELHPKADFFNDFDPVYKDSALEAFLKFDSCAPDYFNIEINANGACIAAFGQKRHVRKNFTKTQIESLEIHSQQTTSGWQILFILPESVIDAFQPNASWRITHKIRCNFYKLSEHPDIEHYYSFSPVQVNEPDFHRTDYFKTAIII